MLCFSCLTFPALAPLVPLANVMGPPGCQEYVSASWLEFSSPVTSGSTSTPHGCGLWDHRRLTESRGLVRRHPDHSSSTASPRSFPPTVLDAYELRADEI